MSGANYRSHIQASFTAEQNQSQVDGAAAPEVSEAQTQRIAHLESLLSSYKTTIASIQSSLDELQDQTKSNVSAHTHKLEEELGSARSTIAELESCKPRRSLCLSFCLIVSSQRYHLLKRKTKLILPA